MAPWTTTGAAAAALALCVSLAAAGSRSGDAPYAIDDFEGAAGLQNWHAYRGGESPPAGGTLALGTGHKGRGAVLQYKLPCDTSAGCSGFVAAAWTPASPAPQKKDPAISLWMRFPPDVEVFLAAKDTSGQTLRFPVGAASIEHPVAGQWMYVAVPLSGTSEEDPLRTVRMKGRLAELALLVKARAPVAVEGSVSFDDIQLLEFSGTFRVGPSSPVELPPPQSLDLTSRLGVNIHLLRDEHSLDLAHEAGFHFARMDMLWTNVERGGRYRFFQYDALLRALSARGMGVLWILDYGHPDHGGSPPRTPQDVAAFARFAEAAATHFRGRDVRYEIWNEPNTDQFWKPVPNPREYAALLGEAAAAIRRADPSAKVSNGGVAKIDRAFLAQAIDSNVAPNLSAIAVHPYRKIAPETIAPEYATLLESARQTLGPKAEVWDTEWGYSSADNPNALSDGHGKAGRRRQAVFAVREMLTVWTVGVPLAVWYDLRDDGTDTTNPEQNYGLLDSAGNEKPAMQALRTLVAATSGRKFAGMVQETPAGIHAMRLEGSADTILIVWNDRPGARRTIEFESGLTSATDLLGDGLKLKNKSGSSQMSIDDAAGPLYLSWKR